MQASGGKAKFDRAYRVVDSKKVSGRSTLERQDTPRCEQSWVFGDRKFSRRAFPTFFQFDSYFVF